jgi:hypothetical protein
MLEQKYINVIRTCLKMMRAFGNEKSKADIQETLKAFDKYNKKCKKRICFGCRYYGKDGCETTGLCETKYVITGGIE